MERGGFSFFKVSTKHCSTLHQNPSITQSHVGKTNPNPALLQGEDLQQSKPHLNWQIPSTAKKRESKQTERTMQQHRLEWPGQGCPQDSSTQHLLPHLFYTIFRDVLLLNEGESTWNTSLKLLQAVINYTMVTGALGCASQRKGMAGNPISRYLNSSEQSLPHIIALSVSQESIPLIKAMDSLVHKPSPSDTPWLQGTEKTSLRPPTPEKWEHREKQKTKRPD